jgi:hypothetical protein
MDPQVLLTAYPWMDMLMAVTLIQAHQNGTLMKHLSDAEDREAIKAPFAPVIVGAITVSSPEKQKP